jgi:predicted dehydrogenase
MKKIGIIGNASVFKNRWYPALQKNKNFEIVGIAREKNVTNLESNERLGYKSFNRNEVDIVYIPLPNSFHYEISKYYLLQGVNVVIEKPSATKYFEVQELVKIANDNSCFFLEAFQWRYHSRSLFLKNKIENGFFPYLIDVVFTIPHFNKENIRYSPLLCGGAAFDLGSYPVSVITTLLPGLDFELLDFSFWKENYSVDLGGSGTFVSNDKKVILKFFYGFGFEYESKLILHTQKGRMELNQPFTVSSDQEAIILTEKNLNISTESFVDCHFNSMLDFISSDFNSIDINIQTLKQSALLNLIIKRL